MTENYIFEILNEFVKLCYRDTRLLKFFEFESCKFFKQQNWLKYTLPCHKIFQFQPTRQCTFPDFHQTKQNNDKKYTFPVQNHFMSKYMWTKAEWANNYGTTGEPQA